MTSDTSLFNMPQGIHTRWASPENWRGERGAAAQTGGGRKGSACFPLKGGEQRTLAEVTGASGTVRRIWATIRDRSPAMLRSIRLDIFWDGAATPAVSVPIGDFFGHALGRCVAFDSALLEQPGRPQFQLRHPDAISQRDEDRGHQRVRAGSGDVLLRCRLHDRRSARRRMRFIFMRAGGARTRPSYQRDFEMLPHVTGRGRFLGMHVGVAADTSRYADSWWGEGEIKMYLDGDGDLPTLAGTGVEDYVGNGWAGNTEVTYAHAHQGFPLNDIAANHFAFYRFHIPDPVYFHGDIRVVVQQIGAAWVKSWVDNMRKLGGPILDTRMTPIDLDNHETIGLFEREDDWSGVAYFYLDRPENGLPALAPVASRVP